MKKLFSLFVVLANVLMINNLSPIELKASDIQQSFNIQDRSYYSLLFSNIEDVHAGTNTTSSTYTSRSQTEIFTDIYSYIDDDGNEVEYPIYSYCSTGLIYTPNGTDVSDFSLTNYFYETVKYTNDHPDKAKEQMTAEIVSDFPNAEIISEATASYNCHSYAWYNQDVLSNDVWLCYPYVYYHSEDMSYERVYNPRVGDIICYFNVDVEEKKQNIHSGIVVGFTDEVSNGVCGNANTVVVQSKWGHLPLFEHKGDECPYTSTYGGAADEVRYYRPRINNSYSLSSQQNTLSISREINSNGSIVDKYGMYELNVGNSLNSELIITSNNELDNRLYDINMRELQLPLVSEMSNEYTYVKHLSAGTYYLRVAYDDLSNNGTINITIEPHTIHTYGYSYSWKNLTQHLSSCACGNSTIQVHAVLQGSTTCIQCGGQANVGINPYVINLSEITYTTKNGSYILPNGIVVLVEEDINAYLKGILTFDSNKVVA